MEGANLKWKKEPTYGDSSMATPTLPNSNGITSNC